MALIKCPECDNKISDQADACPKCGYELNKPKQEKNRVSNNSNNSKFDYKYIIIGLLILVVGFYMLNQRNENRSNKTNQNNQTTQQDSTTTPGTNSGYVVYNDTNLGVSYEIPSSYKTFVDKNKLSYVGKNIDNEGPLVPYIVLGWDTSYTNPVQFLNAFTDELRKVYGDVTITINVVSNTIGSYYVYGIQYMYTSSGHTVIDNRYVTSIGGKLFMIGTKEENTNTKEINDIVAVMFNTLKGGN